MLMQPATAGCQYDPSRKAIMRARCGSSSAPVEWINLSKLLPADGYADCMHL